MYPGSLCPWHQYIPGEFYLHILRLRYSLVRLDGRKVPMIKPEDLYRTQSQILFLILCRPRDSLCNLVLILKLPFVKFLHLLFQARPEIAPAVPLLYIFAFTFQLCRNTFADSSHHTMYNGFRQILQFYNSFG